MRVKKYVVNDIKEALQKIKKELGNNAIILSQTPIKEGGFLGLFAKQKLEVMAAVDTATPATENPVVAKVTQTPPQPTYNPNQFQALTTPRETDSLPFISKPLFHEQQKLESALAATAPRIVTEDKSPRVVTEDKTPTGDSALLEEMKQMRTVLNQLAKNTQAEPVIATSPVPSIFQKWEDILLDQEIDSSIVSKLIEKVESSLSDLGTYKEEDVEMALKMELRSILSTQTSKALLPTTKVCHFIGPTGAGKTTSIAKLAAIQSLRHGKKVGFIAADTYRMAAVDQLRTYASILNAPLEVIVSPNDLSKAFESLADRDIIFMDTAGRNFKNEMYVSEVNNLIQHSNNCETFLVLSLTGKYRDMKQIARNFSKFKIDKVLFTKMDETNTYGSIINLIHDFGLGLSYVANGQDVPNDISEMDENKIINLLLEEVAND